MTTSMRKILIPAVFAAVLALVMAIGTGSAFAAEKQTITTPQKNYGVAVNAKVFNLNAKAKTALSYKSSDPSVALVSAKGNVKGKKKGIAYITITAKGTDKYNQATKKVRIMVSQYNPANGKMAHAPGSQDFGRSGDITGREALVQRYVYGPHTDWKNWSYIIRCNDPEIAKHAAVAVTYIVQNNHFGYKAWEAKSQKYVSQRHSVYKAIRHGGVPRNPTYAQLKRIKSIRTKADTSCTPMLLAGYGLYIDMASKIRLNWRSPYHTKRYTYFCLSVNVEQNQLRKAIRQVNREYRAKGKLEPFTIIDVPKSKRSAYFGKSTMRKYLKRGDIVCSCPNPNRNGHTAMIL